VTGWPIPSKVDNKNASLAEMLDDKNDRLM